MAFGVTGRPSGLGATPGLVACLCECGFFPRLLGRSVLQLSSAPSHSINGLPSMVSTFAVREDKAKSPRVTEARPRPQTVGRCEAGLGHNAEALP